VEVRPGISAFRLSALVRMAEAFDSSRMEEAR
jgi:hypothetical protein